MTETNGAKKPAGTMIVDGKERELFEVDGNIQYVDENDNTFIVQKSGDKTLSEPKKPSKLELKRLQQHLERRKRLLGRGIPEDKVDAVMAEEDYRNLPLEKKFERFQATMVQAFQRMARDVMALDHNNNALSEVMDSNYRCIARCLEKAGVSREQQSEIIQQVRDELEAEKKQAFEAAKKKAEEEAKKHQEAAEKSVAQELAKAEGKPSLTEVPPPQEEAPIPEGATTFGG